MNKMEKEILGILDETLIVQEYNEFGDEFLSVTDKSQKLASLKIMGVISRHTTKIRKNAHKDKWKWLRGMLYSFIQKTRKMEKEERQ